MAQVILVRHGRAAASFETAPDPGLDDEGRRQAAAAAAELAAAGPLPVLTSPLRRTRETAAAFEQRWGVTAVVEPAIGEIPTPPDWSRKDWLRQVMTGRWQSLPALLQDWRQAVLARLALQTEDCVMVTHFIAINVIVGHALGQPRVLACRPDNGSVTVVEVAAAGIRLVSLGRQGESRVW